jgi:hypothetical protein
MTNPTAYQKNQRLFQLEDNSWYQSTIYLAQASFKFVHSSLALRFCVEAHHACASGNLLIDIRSQSKRRDKSRREENVARSKVVLKAMGYASSSGE